MLGSALYYNDTFWDFNVCIYLFYPIVSMFRTESMMFSYWCKGVKHIIFEFDINALCFCIGSLPQQQSICQNHHRADREPPVQRRQQVRRGDPPQTTADICMSTTAFLLIQSVVGILTGDPVPALPVDRPPTGSYCDSSADARHWTVVPCWDVRLLLPDAGSNIVRAFVLQAEVWVSLVGCRSDLCFGRPS